MGFVHFSRDREDKHMQFENKRSTCYQSITVSVDMATSNTVSAAQTHHYLKFLIWETQRKCTFLCWWTHTEHGQKAVGFSERQWELSRCPKRARGLRWGSLVRLCSSSAATTTAFQEMLVVLAPLLVDNCPPHTWLSLGWGEVMNRPTKWTQASLPREATFDQCWATYAGLSRGARRQLREKHALL